MARTWARVAGASFAISRRRLYSSRPRLPANGAVAVARAASATAFAGPARPPPRAAMKERRLVTDSHVAEGHGLAQRA